jgi:anti-sigma regulatory factor (Ser/Thr protein kinase)
VSIQQVGSCIEEAILNASRHGHCSWIGIEIVNTETLFQIFFKDNGSGFKTHNHGFGSKIFTEATNGQWDIWRDDLRALTVLQLNLRLLTTRR